MKKYCCCCGKQFVLRETNRNDEWVVEAYNAVSMGCGKHACKYCAEDLDENGLFPEERKKENAG